MEIYTKKGDKGFTSTVDGEKVSKTDILLEVQGKVDEVNANIGHLRSIINEDLDVVEKNKIDENVKFLENKIDFFQKKSGKLENFIYYSGSRSVTYTHVVRSLTRTAERTFARFIEDIETPYDYKFVNRLSDFMYALARYIKYLNGEEDEIVK